MLIDTVQVCIEERFPRASFALAQVVAMARGIMLCSRSTDNGVQNLYVDSGEPSSSGADASPIPSGVVRRSVVLDSALCNTSGPIPLPIDAPDFYLWLHRSSESVEDKCKALKVVAQLAWPHLMQYGNAIGARLR